MPVILALREARVFPGWPRLCNETLSPKNKLNNRKNILS